MKYIRLMSTRYRLTITILLAALLAGGNAQATGVVVKGSVFGGGNEASVNINTSVNISAGAVEGNVYGGGNLGDVGTHADLVPASTGNYTWTANTGLSQVSISGGTIGVEDPVEPKEHGNVFGGGKGSATTFECEKGMVYNTNVSINTSASVKGNVYGGGEVSRVENNTEVTIGTASESSETHAIIEGSVFGAGAGINTHGYSALVRGTSTVTVQGSAQVKKNVYGGGELASVGRYQVKTPANASTDPLIPASLPNGMPAYLISGGTSTVTIQDNAVIGTDNVTTTGHVYGAGQGLDPYLVTYTYADDDNKPKRMVSGNTWEYFANTAAYLQFVETLALSAETDVTITGSATIKGSVFGGSENGFVYHDTDVKIQGGTVNGDAFGGGRGLDFYAEAGRVRGNTEIAVSGSAAVHGNVYGGGNLGDVGTINKSDQTNYNYVWKNSDANGNNLAVSDNDHDYENAPGNNTITGTNTNTGICTVTISGGTIGVDNPVDATKQGNVFGAGKGLEDTWWCEKAISFATNVSISAGTVKGNVYGGGQLGRVEDDTKVTIGEGTNAPVITGNVFGAGAGTHTHGYSALVRGNADVTVQGGAQIGGSVYGGGEIASVGRFNVVGGLPKDPLSGGTCTVIIDDDAAITGDVFGACKGVNPSGIAQADRKSMQLLTNAPENTDLWSHYNNDENSLFIWRTYATDADYLAFLETLALTSNTEVTISGNATVNESVYGGGQRGITLGSVTVNMTGGTVVNDVYGGGALANTNKGNWDDSADNYIKVNGLTTGTTSVDRLYTKTGNTYTPASGIAVANTDYYSKGAWADNNATSSTYTTKVILTGGTVSRVFGGALGDDDNRAKVYGDILVVLNGTVANNGTITRIGNTKGCMVDYIFGANNLYGTPMGKVKVQVEATQSKVDENDAINKKTSVGDTPEGATNNSRYDVLAVYGGGNLSAYEPFDAFLEATAANKARIDAARTSVIINGCHYTSIKQVYGGGNAASVAAAHVQVNGTHEINEVFGGGNGNDPYTLDNLHYNNPGANVGYYNYTHWGSQTGTVDDPFEPIDNTDASTPEQRRTNYHYGSGIATTEIYGGLIHSVYGGSNQKGNISTTAISIYDNMDEYNCPVTVDETYGGGKNAPMDGEIQLNLDCVKNMPMIFGGAKNADINSDIVLNITNGSFDKVFGGNNQGGAIYGSITVNLEESGCQPIYINELYAGGYYAPYSIYGYEKDDQGNYSYSNGKLIPLESAIDNTQPDASRTPSSNPLINIISATKINNVFGGGYEATMVGSPHINVNMKAGKIVNVGNDYTAGDKTAKKPDNTDYTYTVTSIETDGDNKNAVLAIGSIGNIYGGGNLADVVGNTYVEIGTGQWINEDGKIETEDADGHKYTYEEKTPGTWKWYDENDQEVVTAPTPARNAATITGDVFGGGQGLADDETSAKVTGNSYINLANGSIAKSIYGGGEQAQIDGNTDITVSGGTIGTNELGGKIYGNIYGGGKGNTSNVLSGLITGNTNVTVSDGTILHNIYGGGAYGSVGTYTYDNNNVITGHTANTGTANIWITGGTIGTDGKENGMVFGSSRGDVGEPDGIHDRLAWVYDTKVIIGDTTANATITTTTPLIKGSIYGGGENGHNYNDAYVRINGGTIGIASGDDVTDPDDNTITYKAYNYPYRGNVYGGGCGTDMYDSNGDDVEDSYNPKAGIVLNNARVNITGGHIIRNVYGAGAMGSVGTITNDINEKDANDKYIYRHDQTKTESYRYPYSGTYQGAFYNFGLSWPVELVYPTTSGQDAHTYTGKTAVTITGSTTTIGVSNSDATGGDVYGAARGEAGDRFEMAGFANVREASVTIGTIGQDGPDIKGSVFGGSANGHVYEDASVVINSGTIAHSVYGGGNGNGTYKSTLWKPKSSAPDDITLHDETEIQDIYSFNAGKVYGNTNVTINGGTVKRNVYGGGNLGSVGKGNYSGGTDDYSTVGYGELPAKDNDQETALWTNSLFTNSGLATVIINSGTIGESGVSYDGLPTGNVFGSSRGKAALNVGQRSPRYKYVPDFFLGYTNETAVIIGSDDENYSGTNPIIYGSVYGGGQDGHVRRGTNVTVNKGTIGMASEGGLDRGNVFGAGSGIGTYTDVYDNNTTKCSNSSGSVTSTTTVDIKGGTIYQNVYGGGALASVGPPWAGQGAPLNSYDERKEATETSASYSYTQVNIKGGNISGSVYGASRGPSQSLIEDVFTVNDINTYDAKSFATVIWADVNVTGNAGIAGSVFGGGEKGIVKHATEVNIGTTGNNGTYTGTISQNVYGGGKEAIVGGNVTVNINSGTITHNVFGGGDQANTNTNSVKINNVNETGAYNTADEPANGVSTVVTMSGASAQAATVYGGGNLADVIGNVTVNIEDGTLTGSYIGSVTGAVFGGGFGETTKVTGNVEVNIGTRTETTGGETPTVTYGGSAQITGDVYGGSAKGKVNTSDGTNATENTTTSVNLYGGNITGNIYGGGLGDNTPSEEIAANVYGPVTVTVEGGSATNVYGCNNLYGAPQSSVAVNINGTATPESYATYAIGNVYGGGNQAAYTYTGSALTVDMDGGYVNNIFGGGNLADVSGSIIVTVSGGNVINDVYGGGALANTNTANWDFTNETWADGIINETTGATTYNTTLNLTGGIIGNAYGGALGQLGTGVHYTQSEIENAQEGDDAYGKTTDDWRVEPADGDGSVKAMVYGDVAVTVSGAALPAVVDHIEQTGRVFGCNNINGTPKGKVGVTVTSTGNSIGIEKNKTTLNDRFKSYNNSTKDLDNVDYIDVAAVFGGGNAADYEPVTNQAPKVIIEGCDNVSIGSVYGGGNAAAIPSSDVEIRGAYYIQYVFGGGNGAGTGNRGANVGYKSYTTATPPTTEEGKKHYFYDEDYKEGTNLNILGGYIENAFGGCDTKGDIYGTGIFNISELSDENGVICPLQIGYIYGGGRKAPKDGDVYTLIDCPSSYIRAVYGGSEMADIHGNVILTIAAGRFDEVFGGNRKSGEIDGYITVNIEETSVGCRPIRITNLYGGCDDAPYSGEANSDGYNVTVNAKAFTSIGSLFGGSKGANATLTGNTLVNVNQTFGYWAGKEDPEDNTKTIPNQLGTIGTIYGGGDQAKVIGNTVVNIGTETTVGFINEPTHLREDPEVALTKTDNLYYVPVLGANITGDVYGGGNKADVTGNTHVNICANESDNNYTVVPEGASKVAIGGNVYGGGKGVADNYECDKAMVGIVNQGTGSTYVYIGNGTIGKETTGGNVYGGGMVGRVEAHTNVTIGFGDGVASGTPTSEPIIRGSVYGAGQGIATHGYSGLVRGNSTVTVQGNTKVIGSVYGGGQKASVGRFWVKDMNDTSFGDKDKYSHVPTGMPYAPISGGKCIVTVKGYAEIGPDDMMMNNTTTGKPDDAGHVFGAGKGLIPYVDTDTESGSGEGQGPGRYYMNGSVYTWEPYNNETDYLNYIETLALASVTDVTIAGNAFIKGSVYGGSENGRVLDSTYVKIQESCQIGAGFNKSTNKSLAKYDEADFIDPTTATADQIEEKAAILQECNSWPYQAPYAPYDPNAIYQNQEDGKYYYDASYQKYAEGGMPVGSDGHTFYGNVFGGGSGYYPYKDSNTGESKWHWEAGSVGGNTRVEISGGHILTNLYGGNELTNVGHGATVTTDGKSTIVMSGGTLGVPRTLGQIAAHPVTCYLFGAGKGDQRVFFNKQTNVNDVDISITGGTIYGSVFGGGEDGHVMRDVTMVIGNTDGTGPSIGTWGTSYVDGNIFGGGRGYAGDAYTAGNVGGSIDLKIKGGTMLGSIYGGGRLGSVGYGLYASNEAGYGEMRDDNKFDDGTTATGFKRGHVNIEISGGTIGNDYETSADLGAVINYIPNTTLDANNKLLHTKGGNVFAGGMGRREQLDGVSEITAVNWKKLGNVKSTKLTIGGSAVIKSNVYGGGEFGAVTGYHITDSKQIGAEIIINGGTIGTLIGTGDNQYAFGSVFGGGMGHNIHGGGDVENNTSVSINDAIVRNNVYGGGEVGSVGKITNFDDLDKQEGGIYLYKHDGYKVEASAANGEGAYYNFGLSWPYKFIYNNTGLASVTITGNTQIGGYVYGAAKGSVEVGTDDITKQRFLEAKIANVRETKVTIGSTSGTQPTIGRSVYGGGEDGHVYEDASIVINGGSIAHSVFGGGKGEGTYRTILLDATPGSNQGNPKASTEEVHSWTAGKVYGNTHITMNGGSVGYNIYGGGNLASVGKGNYAGGYDDYSLVGYGELPESDNSNLWTTSNVFDSDDPTTFVNMADYFMGSGKAYVNVNSGTVGTANGFETDENGNKFPYGNVYGSSRGKAALNVGQLSPRYRYTPDFFLGYTNETYVKIGQTETEYSTTALSAPHIYGSVYGGGQDGHVRRHTNVTINKGEIGVPYNSTDVAIKDRGNVYGAGSGMGQYDTGQKDTDNNPILAYNNSSGSVTCTTTININGTVTEVGDTKTSNTVIHQNVYGGGAMASVGPPNAGQLFDEYNTTTDYTIPFIPGVTSTHSNVTAHKSVSHTEVNINGGLIGSYDDFSTHNYGGNVYGASRGGDYAAAILKYEEDPNTYTTVLWPTVNVSDGAIAGNVFGGGEMGMVKCGVNVNITGGTIANDVYGGGALAHTNTSNWAYTRASGTQWSNWNTGSWGTDWASGKVTATGKLVTTYNTKVNVLGGTIGTASSGGDVYGGGLGRQGDDPIEAIVYGDVFVNLNGVEKAEYDADNPIFSSLQKVDLNDSNSDYMLKLGTDDSPLTGAIVNRVFGANNLNGSPKGHIKVHVFATQNRQYTNGISKGFKYPEHPVQNDKKHPDETLGEYLTRLANTYTTGVVNTAISAAQTANTTYTSNASESNKTALDNAIATMNIELNKLYDVQAIYGGGNLAEYVYGKYDYSDNLIEKDQTDLVEAARTEVIIDGCDYSSIRQVYGGGNAASTPGSFVEINGTYEIDEVFGGGNGDDAYELDGVWYENPGANVGYHNYTHVIKSGDNGYNSSTHGDGSQAKPYKAIDNTSSDTGGDASTPESRKDNYSYGSGIATTEIRGGTIHYVFGGSNKKGNISTTALSVYSESDDDCRIDIHETYGGGKDAPMDGEIDLTLDCVKDMNMIFGGAKNADVNSNITLNITNGRFKRVFGGNNTSGAINGSITVNIEEKGCVPIVIDELYGGGYLAPYSIYGYEKKKDGSYDTESVSYIDDDNVVRYLDQRIPLTEVTEGVNPNNDPRINIISATHIGDVYGGGYQAKLVGSPHVNVNMTNGRVEVKNTAESGDPVYKDGNNTVYNITTPQVIDGKNYATLDIGTIDNIYGGGNLADIVGNTYVEIGTGKWITWDDHHNPIWETVDASDKKYTSSQTNDAVNYTQAECNTHNEALTGYIASGVTLTSEKAAAVNTALSTTYNADDVINTEDAAAYNRTLTGFWTTATVKTEAVLYTAEDEEVIAGTKQVGDVKTPAVYYTQTECNTHNATLAGYIACTTTLTAKQAVAVNEAIESNYAAGAIIYTEDAAAFNATLNGHITTADVKTPAVWTWYDANNVPLNTTLTPARNAANITGDVYGGGKGLADNFTCNKAMVGKDGDGINNPDGGTYVTIVNGTIGGSVYGGGMIARVEKNTTVTIGLEEATDATLFRPTSAPVINGNVFGAGKGVETHGYSALVRGNPTVIIQGNTKVGGSVYGGGEIASVARYKVVNGTPVALANKTSGNCKVIVRGNAEIGPDNMKMNNTITGKPDNAGHVFGAGKGILPKIYSYVDNDKPRRMLAKGTPLSSTNSTSVDYDENNIWEYFGNDEDYHKFIETLALSSKTDVTISDNAFVKGSVYGGSQNGIVQYNTHVTIEGDCQIGAGFNETTGKSLPKYNADQFIDPTTTVVTSDNALAECAHWDYGMDTDNDGNKDLFASYDPFAETTGVYDYTKSNYSSIPLDKRRSSTAGGMREASDGHTYYGNVFGGGSGVEPYAPGLWHRAAGIVRGNTVVDITGGHILTSVYGGNEHTDVGTYKENSDHELIDPVSGGKTTINMVGGTLGVPRTLGQIAAHPVTCYLFGAGKGDMRSFFNTWTNVTTAEVNITGNARIYGSVFGGGEDGHVLSDVELNIGNNITIGNTNYTPGDGLIIGTTGTSYVDGNVFGAGRGFNGGAITAGSVGGNVEVNISGGTMLGSIYGGGRMASVGIGFNAATDSKYGQFTEDETGENAKTYGHVTVNISGGTIGNDSEDKFYAVEVETNGLTPTPAAIETLKNNGLQALKNTDKIPYTDFELYDSLLVDNSETKYKYLYRTIHTKGGNVFGGSMGRLTNLDNSFNNLWPQLAQVKTATVNITGGTIKSNVYGGAELGTVRDSTFVTIGGIRNKTNGTISASGSPTIYRDVYGGGYGSTIHTEDSKASIKSTDGVNTIVFGYTPRIWAGIVGIRTGVDIYGGWIKKSVYGGGEMASVGIINYIVDEKSKAMSANTELKTENNLLYFRSTSSGSAADSVYVYIVKHSENESGFALSWPYKTQYIQGYEGKATVNIKGGRIGITGKDFMGPFNAQGKPLDVTTFNNDLTNELAILDKDNEPGKTKYKNARIDNGDVYGGGKGIAGDRYEMAFLANVGSTEVTIDYQKKATKEATPTNYKDKTESGTYANDCITGSVYAGAENGHVMGNTHLTLNNGLIGHAIYGGGKGKGTYMQSITRLDGGGKKTISIYSITAGKVYGNTKVDMTGGYVVRNVYGGGNMGSVGKGNYAGGIDDYSSTGYGEALNGNLWSSETEYDNAWQFLNSGKTEVTITGGTIGYIKPDDAEDSMKDGLPYGNVFGGCRGESAPNIRESPRYHYSPQFYSGYTNETKVTIGTEGSTEGPTICGSVYGGGQDGHVRRDANVTIYSGEIGRTYSADALNITDPENPVWLHSGNVYGAGSGIGKYQYDFNYDGDFDDDEDEVSYNGKPIKEQYYSTSAGSVTSFTNVEINGGTIHRNVYGGGSLASVGAPKIPPTRTDVPYIKGDTVTGHGVGRQSLNEVIINGGTIGDTNSRTVGYGGNVYGASRGLTELGTDFATSVWTKVEANSGHIYGNVFGGGEAGSVTMDSKVIIGGKVENTNSGSGAPRRTTPAVQPDAAAPANTNSSSNSSTVTPANVATEAPDARSIRSNRANQ